MARPRRVLRVESAVLRRLMELGMLLDRRRSPRPLSPAFRQTIPAKISSHKGRIELLFYAPAGWRPNDHDCQKYPVLVNFHAGGFTVGNARDDNRWATAVVEIANAVVVCVNYRLAPKYPFPTAIDDGVDALSYVFQNAQQLNLDTDRVGLSGFSSGGSMAFTVWLKFHAELRRIMADNSEIRRLTSLQPTKRLGALIVSWYPSVDFATHTRNERRSTNVRPEKEVPRYLTRLFDACYLDPRTGVSLTCPFISPAVAPDEILQSLPEYIIIRTCEWDGLRAEAALFKERLEWDIGKRVQYRTVPRAVHAWDKGFRQTKSSPSRDQAYQEVCLEIRRIFNWC